MEAAAMVYDYKCKSCEKTFTVRDAPIGHKAICSCGGETERYYIVPPAIKLHTSNLVQKGIKKDLIEMTYLEEAVAASGSRSEKYELTREIQKINDTPVKGK
jgi:hypothetical protein